MKRAYGQEVLACPTCGDRRRLVAVIMAPRLARKFLDQLGLSHGPPPTALPRPAQSVLALPDAADLHVDPIYPD